MEQQQQKDPRKRATTLASPTSRAPATPRMLKNASSRASFSDSVKSPHPDVGSPVPSHRENFPDYPSPPQQYTNTFGNPNTSGNANLFKQEEHSRSDRRGPKLEVNTQANKDDSVIAPQPEPYNPQRRMAQTSKNGSPTAQQSNRNSQHRHGDQPPQFHRRAIGDWDFVRTIGAGSMGKVKEATHRRTHEVCAVKIVPRASRLYQRAHANDPPPADAAEQQKRIKEYEKEVARDRRTIREAALGKLLYHPYICRLYEMITMTNHYYMLFEFVTGGQMLDYIVSHGSLRERHARKFARGIASSLDYCHRNNVVHRDLKIENIMISKTGDIKIIDFGLSNLFDSNKLLKTYCGSLYFAAPELLSAHPYVGPEVDVWSFGVVLYVLVCGKVPFDDQSVTILHEKIKKGAVEYPASLSEECVDLLSQMLVVNPKKRASLRDIINHRWMNKNYDSKPHSYVPYRRPLELPLNPEVLKEIEKLELGSVEFTSKELVRVLSLPEYEVCTQKWYEKEARYIANDVPKDLRDFDDPNFADPTNAYHPLISIYFLVDEMRQRQLAKSQNQVTSPFLERNTQELQRIQRQQELELAERLKQQQLQQQQYQQQQQQQQLNAYIPTVTGPELEKVPEAGESPVRNEAMNLTDSQPANVDEVLAFPEQAHTSTVGKDGKSPDLVISPVSNIIPEQQLSPKRAKSVSVGSDDPKSGGINGLIRRLSGHRRTGSKNGANHLSYVPDSTAPPVPNLPGIKSFNYDNATAAAREKSENQDEVSSNDYNLRKSGSMKFLRPESNNLTPEVTKRGQRKQRAGHSRAVSASAASYAQNHYGFEPRPSAAAVNAEPNDVDDSATLNETINEAAETTVQTIEPAKKSTTTSASRSKTVGHGRSKSIGYKKGGFQDVVPPLPHIKDNNVYNMEGKSYDGGDRIMTEDAIVESAKNAEPGTMPSIEFPKTLYLKGFFSVQTTSTKPAPVIRQSVINCLQKLGVDFLEVKGGFVCTFNLNKDAGLASNNTSAIASAANSTNTAVTPEAASVTNKVSTSNFSHNSSDSKDALSINTNGKGHRRKFSIGFKKQQTTPKIPSTPLFSPTSPNPNHSLDGESSASLESLTGIGASDMILSSRINQVKLSKSTQRNPLRFEIYIVKIPLLSLYGVQLKKLSGNAWAYKALADHILTELNL